MSDGSPRPARLDDVARAAGVHVSTVSRVLNRRDELSIRPETRQRIVETAQRLRCRPNAIALGLAGRMAAEHLLAGPRELDTVEAPLAGFLEAARAAGVEPVVEAAALSEPGGCEAMLRLLERDPAPTAVYVANINQAVGALAGVRRSGRCVPDDLAVICHDDDPVCEFLDPPLTAIRMPLLELGATVVDALIEQIEGGRPQDVFPAEPVVVPRASTAAA